MHGLYDTDNVFAKIIRKELPADYVYEDESVIAINDIRPVAPVHILVMPKSNCISFDDFIEKASEGEIEGFFRVVHKIARDHGLSDSGYRLVANHGESAFQEIGHFHMHIIGGKKLRGL